MLRLSPSRSASAPRVRWQHPIQGLDLDSERRPAFAVFGIPQGLRTCFTYLLSAKLLVILELPLANSTDSRPQFFPCWCLFRLDSMLQIREDAS
jgi:hypothetical protein